MKDRITRHPQGVLERHRTWTRTALTWAAGAIGLAAGAYAGYAWVTWRRYGHPPRPHEDETDALLDRFMPVYEIAERHHIHVAAPPDVTFVAACEQDLMSLPLPQAIFKARAIMLGSNRDAASRPRGLLDMTKSIGWGVLAHVPGRKVVMGAVTQPWRANVVFRPLPPDEFAAFNEPGYVKIAWTLRADARGSGSIFRTETRAVATDKESRSRFRRYWSLLSPGIVLIRRASLDPLKREAERRALTARMTAATEARRS
jgi:hypothetical protein